MRFKQTIFLVLIFCLALGVGALGFWFGPEVGKYTQDLPQPVLAATTVTQPTNVISTVFAPEEVYKDFFNYPRPTIASSGTIMSLVLPHHLVAGSYISGVFGAIKNLRPPVVVVIGPNHPQT